MPLRYFMQPEEIFVFPPLANGVAPGADPGLPRVKYIHINCHYTKTLFSLFLFRTDSIEHNE